MTTEIEKKLEDNKAILILIDDGNNLDDVYSLVRDLRDVVRTYPEISIGSLADLMENPLNDEGIADNLYYGFARMDLDNKDKLADTCYNSSLISVFPMVINVYRDKTYCIVRDNLNGYSNKDVLSLSKLHLLIDKILHNR